MYFCRWSLARTSATSSMSFSRTHNVISPCWASCTICAEGPRGEIAAETKTLASATTGSMPRQCAEIQRRARFSARILVDLVGGDSVRGCLIRGSPSSTTAVITSCAFDMADLPHGEGVNYVARHLSTMSWNQTLSPLPAEMTPEVRPLGSFSCPMVTYLDTLAGFTS